MVRVLADAGAELERTTHEGLSPLAAACSQQLPRTAKFLLERGVKVGGVKGKEGQHFVPLVEAAARRSETLVFLLLKWGADPSQAGWERESCHQSKRYVLISPLQKAITVPYTFFFKGGDAAENIYRIVKLLIERGARCPVSTPREALNEGDSPPLSDKSHLLAACYMRHIGLVQLLCGAGGADPNVCGRATDHCQKPVSPLASVLCDRRWHKDNKIENDIKTQWELAGALVEAGARVDLLSAPASWPLPLNPRKRFGPPFPVPVLGSGSWLADLISLEEARGPLLLQIIRTAPLEVMGEYPWGDRDVIPKGPGWDSCPLVVAIEKRWVEGVRALLERGVSVERRNKTRHAGRRRARDEDGEEEKRRPLKSPLFAAVHTHQWEVARELLLKGATMEDGERSDARVMDSLVPPDLRSVMFQEIP